MAARVTPDVPPDIAAQAVLGLTSAMSPADRLRILGALLAVWGANPWFGWLLGSNMVEGLGRIWWLILRKVLVGNNFAGLSGLSEGAVGDGSAVAGS
jgi:hypothetical protein